MRAVERYLVACLFGLLGCRLSSALEPAEAPSKLQVQKTMDSVPLAFEPNMGQSAADKKFIVHRAALTAGFAPDSISVALPGKSRPARLEIGFDRPARLAGEQELSSKTNYLRGNDPAAWRTGI